MPEIAYVILYLGYPVGFLYLVVNTDRILGFIRKWYTKIKTRRTGDDIDSIVKQARSRTRQ